MRLNLDLNLPIDVEISLFCRLSIFLTRRFGGRGFANALFNVGGVTSVPLLIKVGGALIQVFPFLIVSSHLTSLNL